MSPEEILSRPPRILSQAQRESYFEEGYLLVESFIDAAWLERLRAAVDRLVEASKAVSASNEVFDLETGHQADRPRLRRVSSPCDQDPEFWAFLTQSPAIDLLEDLLGPDVKYYQSKLNFKWQQGGTEVKWHQDAPFFPHSNDAVLTCGTYLYDCDRSQGPLAVIPKSHQSEIYDHYDDQGIWRGAIGPRDLERVALKNVRYLCGPAGSVTLHNYREVHGSEPNRSDFGRPLLLNVVSAADAMPCTPQPLPSQFEQGILRGQPAKFAHYEAGRHRLPPDWSRGYTSIFDLQQRN